MVGRLPVKPTSGNTGSPEPKFTAGIKTSRLSASEAAAFCTSAWARRTVSLLRCAISTTVRSETCAGSRSGSERQHDACEKRQEQAARTFGRIHKCRFSVTV